MSQVSEFFDQLPQRIKKEKVAGVTATYQFEITGDEGGSYWVKLNDGEVTTGEGTAEDANVTITMKDQDFSDMLNGKLQPQTAFLTGKLKLQGDTALAMKLQSIFS